jgi:hypothetical protein
MSATPNASAPFRIARVDDRGGQRFAVLALTVPSGSTVSDHEAIYRAVNDADPAALKHLLERGFYQRIAMSSVCLERPPARPIGDLIVDLYDGAIHRIVHDRAIATPLTVETRGFAARLH